MIEKINYDIKEGDIEIEHLRLLKDKINEIIGDIKNIKLVIDEVNDIGKDLILLKSDFNVQVDKIKKMDTDITELQQFKENVEDAKKVDDLIKINNFVEKKINEKDCYMCQNLNDDDAYCDICRRNNYKMFSLLKKPTGNNFFDNPKGQTKCDKCSNFEAGNTDDYFCKECKRCNYKWFSSKKQTVNVNLDDIAIAEVKQEKQNKLDELQLILANYHIKYEDVKTGEWTVNNLIEKVIQELQCQIVDEANKVGRLKLEIEEYKEACKCVEARNKELHKQLQEKEEVIKELINSIDLAQDTIDHHIENQKIKVDEDIIKNVKKGLVLNEVNCKQKEIEKLKNKKPSKECIEWLKYMNKLNYDCKESYYSELLTYFNEE